MFSDMNTFCALISIEAFRTITSSDASNAAALRPLDKFAIEMIADDMSRNGVDVSRLGQMTVMIPSNKLGEFIEACPNAEITSKIWNVTDEIRRRMTKIPVLRGSCDVSGFIHIDGRHRLHALSKYAAGASLEEQFSNSYLFSQVQCEASKFNMMALSFQQSRELQRVTPCIVDEVALLEAFLKENPGKSWMTVADILKIPNDSMKSVRRFMNLVTNDGKTFILAHRTTGVFSLRNLTNRNNRSFWKLIGDSGAQRRRGKPSRLNTLLSRFNRSFKDTGAFQVLLFCSIVSYFRITKESESCEALSIAVIPEKVSVMFENALVRFASSTENIICLAWNAAIASVEDSVKSLQNAPYNAGDIETVFNSILVKHLPLQPVMKRINITNCELMQVSQTPASTQTLQLKTTPTANFQDIHGSPAVPSNSPPALPSIMDSTNENEAHLDRNYSEQEIYGTLVNGFTNPISGDNDKVNKTESTKRTSTNENEGSIPANIMISVLANVIPNEARKGSDDMIFIAGPTANSENVIKECVTRKGIVQKYMQESSRSGVTNNDENKLPSNAGNLEYDNPMVKDQSSNDKQETDGTKGIAQIPDDVGATVNDLPTTGKEGAKRTTRYEIEGGIPAHIMDSIMGDLIPTEVRNENDEMASVVEGHISSIAQFGSVLNSDDLDCAYTSSDLQPGKCLKTKRSMILDAGDERTIHLGSKAVNMGVAGNILCSNNAIRSSNSENVAEECVTRDGIVRKDMQEAGGSGVTNTDENTIPSNAGNLEHDNPIVKDQSIKDARGTDVTKDVVQKSDDVDGTVNDMARSGKESTTKNGKKKLTRLSSQILKEPVTPRARRTKRRTMLWSPEVGGSSRKKTRFTRYSGARKTFVKCRTSLNTSKNLEGELNNSGKETSIVRRKAVCAARCLQEAENIFNFYLPLDVDVGSSGNSFIDLKRSLSPNFQNSYVLISSNALEAFTPKDIEYCVQQLFDIGCDFEFFLQMRERSELLLKSPIREESYAYVKDFFLVPENHRGSQFTPRMSVSAFSKRPFVGSAELIPEKGSCKEGIVRKFLFDIISSLPYDNRNKKISVIDFTDEKYQLLLEALYRREDLELINSYHRISTLEISRESTSTYSQMKSYVLSKFCDCGGHLLLNQGNEASFDESPLSSSLSLNHKPFQMMIGGEDHFDDIKPFQHYSVLLNDMSSASKMSCHSTYFDDGTGTEIRVQLGGFISQKDFEKILKTKEKFFPLVFPKGAITDAQTALDDLRGSFPPFQLKFLYIAGITERCLWFFFSNTSIASRFNNLQNCNLIYQDKYFLPEQLEHLYEEGFGRIRDPRKTLITIDIDVEKVKSKECSMYHCPKCNAVELFTDYGGAYPLTR